ncbi:MAG TPA: S8 family serine peptidase [Gaiellaceae bacterium]|nr:S8 family serine peptidase [Gaiellaceae bacterium]
MRRAIPFLACAAALLCALPVAAAPEPVSRGSLPRVRPGTIHRSAGGATRVRVVAQLAQPPLAEYAGRTLVSVHGRRKLAVHTASARLYLARLDRAQTRAIRLLRAAIPQARVQERFRIVLDAVTVSLPANKVPALLRLPQFTNVFPSLRYTLADDTSAGVIGADTIQRQLGADGTGIKIGVVDDGIDQTNPFFDPKGFSYPAGFPKGNTSYTTPKVIVARVFPGPNAGKPGSLPLDPNSSFHGTHVAGIAAGDAGTTAPAGEDHPQVTGLTGVAPKAWLGNYRVFTVPTPIGHVANTPEIIEAFESAVADGMDVINFSGGGPQTDPANDAMLEAVHNTAAAGVVPVIAAGNDRDDFGNGSVGSPGTAPDAITVAAVSNAHVFAPALDVVAAGAPASVKGIPFQAAAGTSVPVAWGAVDQTLVDVGSIVGTDGKPVERHLCGKGADLASTNGTLPPDSLAGDVALVTRGLCPFVTKADQAKAAGAVGIVLVDNREGEANAVPLQLPLTAGMISNLDGEALRTYMATTGGRTTIRVGHDPLDLVTGRSGIVTSFSSSGPTPFGHDLKPDVSAPGGQILSSTLPNTSISRFAVFDGTSMATPHVAGSAALLLQLHPSWTPAEVKSALVGTAGAAWGDTARTQEAPVPLEGGGLVSLPDATKPLLFADPASLSFEDLNVTHGAASKALLVRLRDATGGAGTWTVTLSAQAATAGSSVTFPGTVAIPPGGEVDLPVTASAAAGAAGGEDYGFVVLKQGSTTRRIPYFFLVDKPALASAPVVPITRRVSGDTRTGTNRVSVYRYPTHPYGDAPDQTPMDEDGKETLYELLLDAPAANAGVSIESASAGARIDPFFLGAPDENAVQGFAGTPVDVNALTYDYLLPISAAGASFPRVQKFYVSVDSGRDRFDNHSLAGRYVLRSWVNDVTPPSVHLLTTRISTGRPTIAVRTTDAQSGVDPVSLTIGYKGILVGAASYDPDNGVALFPLPESAPALKSGTLTLSMASSDYEEAKNVDTSGTSIMPNTRTATVKLHVVSGPSVSWLTPAAGTCVAKPQQLLLQAGSPAAVTSVRVLLDGKRLASAHLRAAGIWVASWSGKAKHGRHVLSAVVRDKRGHGATATLAVRSCG